MASFRHSSGCGVGAARACGALLALAWGAAVAAAEPGEETERQQLADGLYARGMHELAAREYEALLKTCPATAKADAVRFRLAESHAQLKKTDAAVAEFGRLFAEYPSSGFRFKAGFRRGELLAQAGKGGEALEAFQALLKADPPAEFAAAARFALGDEWIRAGKPDAAAGAFEEIRRNHGDSKLRPYALLKLGRLYATEEPGKGAEAQAPQAARQGKALEFFAESAKTGPERVAAESVFQMADLCFRQRDFKKSAEQYRKLLGTWPKNPRSAEARLPAAWAEHNAGFYAEALKLAEQASREAGGDKRADWLYLKANCERQLLQHDAALKTYAELLNRHAQAPFANAARHETAVTLYKMGRFADAVAEAGKVVVSADLVKDVYWLLAESHSALQKPAEAIQYYRLIVQDYPASDVAVDTLYRLARHLQARSELKEAAEYYNRLATAHPDHKLAPQALFASGFCLAKAERYAEAARDWSALIRKYPADPLAETATYQKAMGEIRLGRDVDALGTLQDLVKRYPKSEHLADGHYWLGVLHAQAGKAAEAEAALSESLKAKPREDLALDAEFRLAELLRKQGKNAEAADGFKKLLAGPMKEKAPLTTLQWLAEYSFEKKDFNGCAAAGRALAERGKDPAWAQTGWALAGRGHWGARDAKAAGEAFRKALGESANTPFAAESALRLGDIALATNEGRQAMPFYQKAAELAGSDALLGIRARAYAGLGFAARSAGDMETAARYLMSVPILFESSEGDPDLVPQCLFEAAEVFGKLGRKVDADQALKELAERFPASEYAKKAAGN
ncbi:MAG: tetratricopeptide repeat protein [Verrucomicrobiota bacterium]|nr:tetratricopeptide repeat protein [Verrucomicrobiota bacterium]